MIAGAEGADLVETSFDGFFAYGGSISAGETAPLLGQFQVLRPGIAVSQAPAGAHLCHSAKLVAGELDESGTADTGGNPCKQCIHESMKHWLDLVESQVGEDKPHSAVDVETDTAQVISLRTSDPWPPYHRWGTHIPSGRPACKTHNR